MNQNLVYITTKIDITALQLGKFISQDPLLYIDGPNPYTYVNNNPVNFVDPWGLRSKGVYPDVTNEFTELLINSGKVMYKKHLQEMGDLKQMKITAYLKDKIKKYIFFKDQVKPGGEWDYKDNGNKLFGKKYIEKYFKIGDKKVSRDFFGNFGYGYAGSAGNMNSFILLGGGVAAQFAHDYTPLLGNKKLKNFDLENIAATFENELGDSQNVLRGILLHKKHGLNITSQVVIKYTHADLIVLLREQYVDGTIEELKKLLGL